MARIVRRAAKKVMNCKDGHGLLGLLIFDEKLVYENLKKMVNTKANASISMLKWSKNEENLALQDAFSKVFEVSSMWAEVMRDFNEEYRKYRQTFKELLHEEKALAEARKREALHTSRLNRLQKQMDQTKRKSDVGRQRTISNEMVEVISQAEQEQAELEVKATRHEIFKAVRLRESLIQIADGVEQWASKTLLVAAAYKQLANLIPDTPTQLTQDKVFHGAGQSRGIVNDLAKGLKIDPQLSAQLEAMSHSAEPYLYAISAPIKQKCTKYCYADLNSEPLGKPTKGNRKHDKVCRTPRPLPRSNVHSEDNLLEEHNFRRPLSLNDLRPAPSSPPPPVPKRVPPVPLRPKQPTDKLWYARTNRLSSDSDSDGYTEPLPDTGFSNELKKVMISRVLSDGALNQPYTSRKPVTAENGINYYHKLEWHQSAEDVFSTEEEEDKSYVDLID